MELGVEIVRPTEATPTTSNNSTPKDLSSVVQTSSPLQQPTTPSSVTQTTANSTTETIKSHHRNLITQLCAFESSVGEQQNTVMAADLSDSYFENIFKSLLRESLASRSRRHALVEHIKKTIRILSSSGYGPPEVACQNAVAAIIRYHRKTVTENGSVCLLGKYHNVLYIAVKLCYDFRLTTEIVSDLLQEIFSCEKTFERILAGAIYGVTVAHFIAGWKSDFKDQKENISAVGYFLQETASRNLLFQVQTDSGVEMRRFADVPISPWNRAPLVAALQVLNCEIVLLLLRFGASLSFRFFEIYPPGEEVVEKELECVRMLFRAESKIEKKNSRYEDLSLAETWSAVGAVGSVPPRLKHLCRCEIRSALRMTAMLPLGIPKLGLPKSLCDYLDLLSD